MSKCKHIALALVMTGALLMSGCSEQERREIRIQKERIANYAADQARQAQQYATDIAAAVQRDKNVLDAETDRQFHRNMTALGRLLGILAAVAGVIGFIVYSVRRLGERHVEERTKRHAQNLKSIEADPHLRPDQRENLYRTAIKAANSGGAPRIGYGGAS